MHFSDMQAPKPVPQIRGCLCKLSAAALLVACVVVDACNSKQGVCCCHVCIGRTAQWAVSAWLASEDQTAKQIPKQEQDQYYCTSKGKIS